MVFVLLSLVTCLPGGDTVVGVVVFVAVDARPVVGVVHANVYS